jgi:hypothetical protein
MANYLAAILIVAAVALFVAAPLSGGFSRRRGITIRELDLNRHEHDRGLAVQSLRELEFDHAMGKLDEADYQDLKRSLEDRALLAMSAIERLRGAGRPTECAATMQYALRAARPRPALIVSPTGDPSARRSPVGATGSQPVVNCCPQCGVAVGAGYNYCASCGASLSFGSVRFALRSE